MEVSARRPSWRLSTNIEATTSPFSRHAISEQGAQFSTLPTSSDQSTSSTNLHSWGSKSNSGAQGTCSTFLGSSKRRLRSRQSQIGLACAVGVLLTYTLVHHQNTAIPIHMSREDVQQHRGFPLTVSVDERQHAAETTTVSRRSNAEVYDDGPLYGRKAADVAGGALSTGLQSTPVHNLAGSAGSQTIEDGLWHLVELWDAVDTDVEDEFLKPGSQREAEFAFLNAFRSFRDLLQDVPNDRHSGTSVQEAVTRLPADALNAGSIRAVTNSSSDMASDRAKEDETAFSDEADADQWLEALAIEPRKANSTVPRGSENRRGAGWLFSEQYSGTSGGRAPAERVPQLWDAAAAAGNEKAVGLVRSGNQRVHTGNESGGGAEETVAEATTGEERFETASRDFVDVFNGLDGEAFVDVQDFGDYNEAEEQPLDNAGTEDEELQADSKTGQKQADKGDNLMLNFIMHGANEEVTVVDGVINGHLEEEEEQMRSFATVFDQSETVADEVLESDKEEEDTGSALGSSTMQPGITEAEKSDIEEAMIAEPEEVELEKAKAVVEGKPEQRKLVEVGAREGKLEEKKSQQPKPAVAASGSGTSQSMEAGSEGRKGSNQAESIRDVVDDHAQERSVQEPKVPAGESSEHAKEEAAKQQGSAEVSGHADEEAVRKAAELQKATAEAVLRAAEEAEQTTRIARAQQDYLKHLVEKLSVQETRPQFVLDVALANAAVAKEQQRGMREGLKVAEERQSKVETVAEAHDLAASGKQVGIALTANDAVAMLDAMTPKQQLNLRNDSAAANVRGSKV